MLHKFLLFATHAPKSGQATRHAAYKKYKNVKFVYFILQRTTHTPLSDRESDMECSIQMHRRVNDGIKKGKGSNHL